MNIREKTNKVVEGLLADIDGTQEGEAVRMLLNFYNRAPQRTSDMRDALDECWNLLDEAERDEINIRDEMEKWERAYGHFLSC